MKIGGLFLISALLLLCLSGCINQGTPQNTIELKNGAFAPNEMAVSPDATVTWVNHNGKTEDIISNSTFDSGDLADGYEFRYTFTSPGVYRYHLNSDPSVQGEVIVTTSGGALPESSAGQSQSTVASPEAKTPVNAVTIYLSAKNIAYNKSTITVPAGANVTVHFDNQDSGVPHNFAVYDSSAAKVNIFRGEIITGPKMISYHFTAPDKPGTYFFRCDVHPTIMTGQFIVK